MDTNRKTARIVGALFIIATLASILGSAVTGDLNAPDYLIKVSANENQMIIGAILGFIGAAAGAGIAISLYPIVKRFHQGLALGAVGFRIIEAVFLIVVAIGSLLLLTLSQEYVRAGATDASYYQTLGTLIKAGRDWAGFGFSVIAFNLGALMYYYIFYRSKLIPAWLSVWGLIASVLSISAAVLFMFGDKPLSTTSILLNLPIAVQEMVLAIWLIIKGFDLSVNASGSAQT